jgi:Glycosyl transferases group 1/DUF based on E. rectale Gene description (DUF3880)
MTGPGDGSDASLAADERAALIAAHERRVEALRNSAQYRVGELVIASARSPRRLVRLPVDLWRLRKQLLAQHRVDPLPPTDIRPSRDVVVATILDEFSNQALAPEWDQHPLTSGSAAEQFAAIRPAMLFVESAWEGNGGAFRYDLAHYAKRPRSGFREVLAAAAKAGVPTVFWNKEDPVHFDEFADAAARFDWIFTTDADCIDRYVKVSGHDRVEALPFAAQPRLHNPIGAPTSRLARACFAGSWQADNYADRGADVEMLLRPVLEAGLLDIFDRMAAPGARGARFPAPYDRAVLGDRSYSALLDEYRRYACFLNVNSVKTSPTMCSRRVFELLACRTPVVSTPSRAIDELLGDVVVTVDSPADALAAVERLTSDPEHRDRVGHLGYRTVLSRHTYGHRVDGILDRVGIASPAAPPRVTVLAPTNRPEYLDRLLDNFSRQRDVAAELLVLTNSDRFDRAEVDRRLAAVAGARAIHLAEGMTMGECLNAGLDATDARFVAKFDDDDQYGDYFLHDSLLVRQFVDAAIVGKKTFYAYLEATDETVLRFPGSEFTAANRVSGSTMVIDRDVIGDVRFAAVNLGEDIDLCERALARGLVVFSADRFNYVAVRRRDPRSHSWTIGDVNYREGSVRVATGLALEATMV